jgi:ectoine hydroxylase-related dioxygenase (phytanoyl-CoA dioxygenase family)
VDQITDIYGEDLILWESKLFYKAPDSFALPWHQHYHGAPITPQTSVTAWIALTDCTKENGCLEFVPGSHTEPRPRVSAPEEAPFDQMADPDTFDDSEVVEMEMRAGQYVLFRETVLHRSSANESDSTRLAVAGRAAPTHVKFRPEVYGHNPDIENHTPILLSGMDEYQVNELATPEFY